MLSTCLQSLQRLRVGTTTTTARCVKLPSSWTTSTLLSIGERHQPLHTTDRNEAARKGTREKARKKKVKVEVKKVGFIPHNQRSKDK